MCRMDKMSLEHHIKHLEEQHRDIDKQIQRDFLHYNDDSLVNTLKKKRLHLKDEIQKFKQQLSTL
jgi:hypothetical protein